MITAAGTLLSGCVVCVCVLTLFQICASQHATSSAAVAACLVCRIGATLSCSVLASSSFLHFAQSRNTLLEAVPSPDLKNLAVQISDTFTERSSTKNTARTLKIDSSPLRPCGLVTVWQDARSARDAAPVRAGTGVCRVVCVGHLVAVSFDCTPSHGPCRDRPAEDRASGGDARVICDPNSRTGSAGSHTTTLCVAPPGTDQHSSARGHTMCMAPSVRACAMWA